MKIQLTDAYMRRSASLSSNMQCALYVHDIAQLGAYACCNLELAVYILESCVV